MDVNALDDAAGSSDGFVVAVLDDVNDDGIIVWEKLRAVITIN